MKVKQPKRMWVDQVAEFQGSFKNLCEKKGTKVYTNHSEKKLAFAKRNTRSLKNQIYWYLEDKWTYSYITKLQDFVNTINGRTNRVTKWLITNNEKRCTVFTLSHSRCSIMHGKQPKDSVGDFARISKADTTFQKRYKQTYTDKLFEIIDATTKIPASLQFTRQKHWTHSQKILRKWVEQGCRTELIRHQNKIPAIIQSW